MTTNTLKILDPVQGLVDFVLDIKPYHTKIVEVLIEYVYNEFVDVVILDNMHLKMDLLYPSDPSVLVPLGCDGGYGTRPYGDFGRYPVMSPNVSIPFETFPAIDAGTNTITIPGDRAGDLTIGTKVYLVSMIVDYSNVHDIIGVSSGVANISNPPTFTVSGNQTSQFVVGYIFDVEGSGDNDRSYGVIAPSTFNGTDTIIPVGQSILSSVVYGRLGIEKTNIGGNTGEFTVSTSTFNGGFIDSWPDITDPSTFAIGNSPYTQITLIEPLTSLPVLGANETYVAFITIAPIVIAQMLSYSNFATLYNPLLPDFEQTPDEGHNQLDLIDVTASTLDGFGSPLPDSGKFVISGNLSVSNVFIGQSFRIVSSTGNNGIYIISSIVYDQLLDQTTFGTDVLVASSIVDGQFIVDIAANVFIVSGNKTTRFVQGTQFDVVGGSYNNAFTVLNSDFVDGQTRIRVIGDVINFGAGFNIISTTGGFGIHRDITSKFPAGSTFNVIGSSHNDGVYTVDVTGPTYDIVSNITTVPVVENVDPTIDGELHPFLQGLLVDPVYGYSDAAPMCDYVPATVVHVVFDEQLEFSSGILELSDDLIVYNMENTDSWGYELPISTILAPVQPPLPVQLTAPLLPGIGDAWFDTSTNIFRQYNGYAWGAVVTIWWADTTNNQLYYRTKNSNVDTGWVLDSNKIPGYSDVIAAVGQTEQIHDQLYVVGDIGGGVPNDTYTLSVPVPGVDSSLLRVAVNGVPAGIILNSNISFSIISPNIEIGDDISAEVYDRTRTETNARVLGASQEPHIALHEYVTTDVANNAYIIGGGNFIDRFNPATIFEGIGNGILGTWNATMFGITDVDDVLGTITISGDYSWLFTVNRVFVVSSENNTNSFEVQASLYDGTATTIAVAQPPVYESPNGSGVVQYFYNPGVVVFNIDNVTDTIIVLGNVVDVYTNGLVVRLENSSSGNNGVWTVASTTYDSINDRTNITVVEDIPDPDSSMNANVQTPIFQNYSRDLGGIFGAVYDPNVNGAYPINQTKTIVVPTMPINGMVDGIAYQWIGPLRMDINMVPETPFMASLSDRLGVGNDILGIPNRYAITDTNAVENYFVIGYTDPISGDFVDLTDSFTARTIFDVVGSYSNGVPSSSETNDSKFVVDRTFFDDPKLKFVASGSTSTAMFDNVFGAYDIYRGNALVIEGVDYTVDTPNELTFVVPLLGGDIVSQVPAGIPINWSTGSGNTFVQIDTNFNNIPPYTAFNVVGVSNNGPSANTMRLSGNHVTMLSQMTDHVFGIDQPLVVATSRGNILTVTNIVYDGGLMETVLTVEEDFINEAFTGSLGIIEAVYGANVMFDDTNVVLPWIHGDILLEVYQVGQIDNTLTATTIDDNISFGWGTVQLWQIVDTDNIANLDIIDHDNNASTPNVRLYRGLISLDTDLTGVIEPNDRVTIKGSQNNDDDYEIASLIYNAGLTNTEIVLRSQPKNFVVTTTADISGSLDGKYFLISSSTTDYYVWLDVDNGNNDPLVVGRVAIEVHVPSNATADNVAINTAAAIDSVTDFSSTSSSAVVTIDSLSDFDPLQYARDFDTNFVVDNYVLPNQPATQFGYLELAGIDVTDWFQYLIKELDPSSDLITINGNGIGDIQSGQQIRVIGTPSNDNTYTIGVSPMYDPVTNTTTIPVDENIGYGSNAVIELVSSNIIKVLGDSYRFVQQGDSVNVVNSTGNNGVYSVVGTTKDGIYSVYTVVPSFPNATPDGDIEFHERGGWIESLRYQGIRLFHTDNIGVTVAENAAAVVLTEGGSLVGAWEYPYWDVGSFDESLGTVIHLYSNVFNP